MSVRCAAVGHDWVFLGGSDLFQCKVCSMVRLGFWQTERDLLNPDGDPIIKRVSYGRMVRIEP